MITRGPWRFIALLLAAGALAGCSTSPISRIDSNRSIYESWPLEVQQAVLAGRADKGMTPEQVKMAMGEPSQVESRAGKGGEDEEVWIYRTGSKVGNLLGNTNVSMGGNIGGIGVMGPTVPIGGNNSNASDDEHDVIFQNGVVVRSN